MIRRRVILGIICLSILGLGLRFATQTAFMRPQQKEPLNEKTSGLNADVIISLFELANRPVRLSHVGVRCSAGSATLEIRASVINVLTLIYSSGAGGIGTTLVNVNFPIPITNFQPTPQQIDVKLTQCGAGNTGFLSVVGDRG